MYPLSLPYVISNSCTERPLAYTVERRFVELAQTTSQQTNDLNRSFYTLYITPNVQQQRTNPSLGRQITVTTFPYLYYHSFIQKFASIIFNPLTILLLPCSDYRCLCGQHWSPCAKGIRNYCSTCPLWVIIMFFHLLLLMGNTSESTVGLVTQSLDADMLGLTFFNANRSCVCFTTLVRSRRQVTIESSPSNSHN